MLGGKDGAAAKAASVPLIFISVLIATKVAAGIVTE